MSEQKADKKKRNDKEPAARASRSGSRKGLLLKSFILILVLLGAVGAAYRAGLLDPAIKRVKAYKIAGKPRAALTGLPLESLISSRKDLSVVGKSPVDPSKVLFPSFDSSASEDTPGGMKSLSCGYPWSQGRRRGPCSHADRPCRRR